MSVSIFTSNMSIPAAFDLPFRSEAASIPIQVAAVGIVLLVWYYIYSLLDVQRPWPGFPVASLSSEGLGPKESFLQNAKGTLATALKLYSGPFQVMTGTGPKIVLPNKFADELRNRPELDFNEAFRKDFFAHYPGFDAFRSSLNYPDLMPSLLRGKLTASLGLVTNNLVDETTTALHELYGEDTKWHSILVKQHNLELIARLSSRVFLGKAICNNKRWLDIAKNHTVDSFMAARDLRAQPAPLRRIMHNFLPHNKAIQKHYSDATKIILPEVQRRKERAEKALASGGKPPRVSDTIGWMVETVGTQKIDYIAAQLNLTVASMHATTEALTTALVDLVTYPEIITQLREEVFQVVREGGWSKQTLYNMKLMDSFLKESQRLHPASDVSMNRKVMRSLTLSDGTVLPKGSRIMIVGGFHDPQNWENPEKFDAARFLKLRDTGSNYQYVSTSKEMFGFGHGKHACPGRFLAATELKVALAHLLLKYDWKFDESDTVSKSFFPELNHMTNPGMKMMLRRRKEEIKLDLDVDPDLINMEE